MLSGVKFIPRDLIDKAEDDVEDSAAEKRKKKSSRKKDKHKKRKNRYSSDDDLDRIKKGSGRNKKWYSSDEYSSKNSSDSESDNSSLDRDKKSRNRIKSKKDGRDRSDDEDNDGSKKKRRGTRKSYSSKEFSSDDEDGKGSGENRRNKSKKRRDDATGDFSDDHEEPQSRNIIDIARKEMGLDWMLRPGDKTVRMSAITVNQLHEEPPPEEIKKENPRELNPYLKDNGSGYPDDAVEEKDGSNQLPSSAIVGDGGASWRLKALKRAKEQAAREGRHLQEVAVERWGSLGQLAASAASRAAAPSRAHLHAIKNRKRGVTEEQKTTAYGQHGRDVEKGAGRDYLKDGNAQNSEMRAPRVNDSLSWGRRKGQTAKDADIISAAASSLNKFANDGSFMGTLVGRSSNDLVDSVVSHTNQDENVDSKLASDKVKPTESHNVVKESLSANQLAARALQLRLKGKLEEAEKLMQEADSMKAKQGVGENSTQHQIVGNIGRYTVKDISSRRKEEDADRHLAQTIIQNKQYSLSGQADDEYDFEGGPSKKSRKKAVASDHRVVQKNNLANRILTQQERCLFCFENPNRPKHLVVSIANFTYLMLPQRQPVVPGHCCILPMQHDSATRTVDNNVWEEIRNFKKCLIKMFAKQDKELVFLETVMGLAQQRRHCLIECVPLPREIAKEAPLYFKKAIDEAEDEWSQHNAKKLIDTSEKGLRGAIPKNFPYFHVEFGLNKGFVHVIDDEKQFNSSLGLNVLRGMLRLPEEDMYRRRRQESVEVQKQAVANFAREWEPYDWTKELD